LTFACTTFCDGTDEISAAGHRVTAIIPLSKTRRRSAATLEEVVSEATKAVAATIRVVRAPFILGNASAFRAFFRRREGNDHCQEEQVQRSFDLHDEIMFLFA
jgi:hypothetical protein